MPPSGPHPTHAATLRSRCRLAGHDDSVTANRFADRLDPGTYAADDGTVGIFESDPSEADAVWISDRLFRRLVLLAEAYELHALPLLNSSEPVHLNRARCESVLEELEFIAERVDDAPAVATVQGLAAYIGSRLHRPSWDGPVTVESD
jgi:hypothetical protein